MLSLKTCIELTCIIEKLEHSGINRIYIVFDIEFLKPRFDQKFTTSRKADSFLSLMKDPQRKGPFGNNFQMDLLQYIVDNFYRSIQGSNGVYTSTGFTAYEDLFSEKYKFLANSLKRDGYIIKGNTIKKVLPEEIAEAKTETELTNLLTKFNFTTSKGHLDQAINNHSLGNWAGANSQFRPFIESLLIDICKKLLPKNSCDSGNTAIKLLSSTTNPPFFKIELNEIENPKCNKPFVEGLWKRLHPEGSHPGLSDEEDSTFRYHITIVFAHYLLKRLDTFR
jgi:hypothetical protein